MKKFHRNGRLISLFFVALAKNFESSAEVPKAPYAVGIGRRFRILYGRNGFRDTGIYYKT